MSTCWAGSGAGWRARSSKRGCAGTGRRSSGNWPTGSAAAIRPPVTGPPLPRNERANQGAGLPQHSGKRTHERQPSTARHIMTDKDLKRTVESALEFEPSVDATDVGVSVDEGVVTLRGNVGTYAEKSTAERVALRVFGVKAVANDLAVHLPFGFRRTDTEIAQAALTALKWNTMIPEDRITLTVENGWITLNGTLDWQYQRDVAARLVRDLTGVKGVTNRIALKPHVKTSDVGEKIEAAFKRSAEIDARRISVTAQDGRVTLSGTVHSWTERLAAEHAAWAAPGVTAVDDRLAITP